MKDRDLKQLYTILIQDIKEDKETKTRDYNGICQYIYDLKYDLHFKKISYSEFILLRVHFEKQRPSESINKDFFYRNYSSSPFWFPEGFSIRFDFLKHILDNV